MAHRTRAGLKCAAAGADAPGVTKRMLSLALLAGALLAPARLTLPHPTWGHGLTRVRASGAGRASGPSAIERAR
jgi:hypothetical protein